MQEAKNTQRALVRIGFDGTVSKQFRGPEADKRFANEARVLRYLESRRCPFVPRLLSANEQTLEILTTNCGARVQHLTDAKVAEIFAELEKFGVRHDDPFLRNVTYRAQDGRFCVIDFEFAEIIGQAPPADVAAAGPAQVIAQTIQWSGMSDRGRFRPNNEDHFLGMLLDHRGLRYLGKTGQAKMEAADFIFAVSDGMGGARSGEFASRIAVDKITLQLPKQFSLVEDRFSAYSSEILQELFSSIHAEMIRLGRYDANCRDMGTTLTLAWFRRGRVYYGHIGDSRLYYLPASGGIEQISEDHTHVGWLRRTGKINEREHRQHPRKNVLLQALGAGHRYLNPQIGALDYQPGDQFVLCSDGVIEGLWDRGIEDLVRCPAAEDTRSSAQRLVSTAVAESGRDNATAVVVAVE
ncbi:MAG: serine/threonine-protein phosphatase [Pirellulaceae bacterium]|nr:serine/threonine-protein phosphatase [Pirellulaceae bacterium]